MSRRLRLLVFSSWLENVSNWIYFRIPLEQAQAQGIIAYTELLSTDILRRRPTQFDAAVLFRTFEDADLAAVKFLQEAGIPVMYITDDNHFHINVKNGAVIHEEVSLPGLEKILGQVNQVGVYNDFLRGTFSAHSRSVSVLPTYCLSLPARWSFPEHRTTRIGFLGSIGKEIDWKFVTPAIKKIISDYGNKVTFEFIGYCPDELNALDCIRKYDFLNYPAFVHFLTGRLWDIGLAPLAQTPFNISKTDIKFREYASRGIAGIYSDIITYGKVVDGHDGLLISNDHDSWFQAISKLIENRQLRIKLGQNAWSHAQAFSLDNYIHNLLRSLEILSDRSSRKGEVSIKNTFPRLQLPRSKKKTSRKKIMFIQPPYYRLYLDSWGLQRYPTGLGYLASTVFESTDWICRVFNSDFSPSFSPPPDRLYGFMRSEGYQNFRRRIEDKSDPIWTSVRNEIAAFNPDVVGLTAMTPQLSAARRLGQIAKSVNPSCVVILGGPHATSDPYNSSRYGDFDLIVRGEGENTIVEILHSLANSTDMTDVHGISYSRNGNYTETPERKRLENLDLLPFPHTHADEILIDFELYGREAFSNIFASRGCPYNCFFCGSRTVWGRRVRFRSVTNVVDQIKDLTGKGAQFIYFDDDSFGLRKSFVRDICAGLEGMKPNVKWGCEMHVQNVDEHMLSIMKTSGCNLINLGIESGSNDILKKMNKHITIQKALNAARSVRKEGIKLGIFLMVGLPWETQGSLRDTLKTAMYINADNTSYSIFTPYPGSEAFRFCREHGLIDENYDPSHFNHQSPENSFCLSLRKEEFRHFASKIEDVIDSLNVKDSNHTGFESAWREMLDTSPMTKAAIIGCDGGLSEINLESSPTVEISGDVVALHLLLQGTFSAYQPWLESGLTRIMRGGEARLSLLMLEDQSDESFAQSVIQTHEYLITREFSLMAKELMLRQGCEFLLETGVIIDGGRFNKQIHCGIALIFIKGETGLDTIGKN